MDFNSSCSGLVLVLKILYVVWFSLKVLFSYMPLFRHQLLLHKPITLDTVFSFMLGETFFFKIRRS